MTDDARIQELLEEILDSSSPPEIVCAECPELLPEVYKRLKRLRRVDDQLEAIFPSTCSDASGTSSGAAAPQTGLPQIDGYNVEHTQNHRLRREWLLTIARVADPDPLGHIRKKRKETAKREKLHHASSVHPLRLE